MNKKMIRFLNHAAFYCNGKASLRTIFGFILEALGRTCGAQAVFTNAKTKANVFSMVFFSRSYANIAVKPLQIYQGTLSIPAKFLVLTLVSDHRGL